MKKKKPRILILDIETSPILAWVWGLYDQNISFAQIKKDWHLLAWSAKWLNDKSIMYMDQRKSKNVGDDKKILQVIRNLMDEADVIITKNGVRFDNKKLNARFVLNGIPKPSSFIHLDIEKTSRKYFGFTSQSLEYISDKLCKKHKKSKHKKYPGFSLWTACLSGDIAAWKEMESYNKIDVLSTEELYKNVFSSWDKTVNFDVFHDGLENECACGSTDFKKNGFKYTSSGKFQRYACKDCNRETHDRTNLLTKEKRKSLKK